MKDSDNRDFMCRQKKLTNAIFMYIQITTVHADAELRRLVYFAVNYANQS